MKKTITVLLFAFLSVFTAVGQIAPNTFIECKPCVINQTKCIECDGNQILAELFDGMVVTTAGIPTKIYRPFYTTYDARVVTVRDIFGNQAIIHLDQTAYNNIAALVDAISQCKCNGGGGGLAAMLVNDKPNGLDIAVVGGNVEVDYDFTELANLVAPDGANDRIPIWDASANAYTYVTPDQIGTPENFDTISQVGISALAKDPICDCWLLTENAANTGWELASADNIANALTVIGVEAIDANTMKVGTRFELSGLAGAAPRQDYYLSNTAGMLQTTPATIKSHVMLANSLKRHFDVQEHLIDPSVAGSGVLENRVADADGDTYINSTEAAQDIMHFVVDNFEAGRVTMLTPTVPKWTLNGIVDPASFVWTNTDTLVLDGLGATGGWSAYFNNVLYIHDGTNWRSVWDGAGQAAETMTQTLGVNPWGGTGNAQAAIDSAFANISTSLTFNDTTVYTSIVGGTKVEQYQNGAVIKTDTLFNPLVTTYRDSTVYSTIAEGTKAEQYVNGVVTVTDTIKGLQLGISGTLAIDNNGDGADFISNLFYVGVFATQYDDIGGAITNQWQINENGDGSLHFVQPNGANTFGSYTMREDTTLTVWSDIVQYKDLQALTFFNDTTVYTNLDIGTKAEQYQNGVIIKTDTIKPSLVYKSVCYNESAQVPYDLNLLGDNDAGTAEINGVWEYTPTANVTLTSVSEDRNLILFTPSVTRRLLVKTGGANGTIVGQSDDITYAPTGGVITYPFSATVTLTAGVTYSMVHADNTNTTQGGGFGGLKRSNGASDTNGEIFAGGGSPNKVRVRVQATIGGAGNEVSVLTYTTPNGGFATMAVNTVTNTPVDISGGIPATWTPCLPDERYSAFSLGGVGLGLNSDLPIISTDLNEHNLTITGNEITLKAGVNYHLQASTLFENFSLANGWLVYRFVDSGGTPIGSLNYAGIASSVTRTDQYSFQPQATLIYTPTVDTAVKLQIVLASGTADVISTFGLSYITVKNR